uniref:Putative cytokine receptor n=1 Tax=Phlebotomus kandelakii TaxID=1109342 RepID=A0A6B2E6T6_9DIPT
MGGIYWSLKTAIRFEMWLIVFCILHTTVTVRAELGDIFPRAVNLKVGQPLNLTCNVNWTVAQTLKPPFNEKDLDLLIFKNNSIDVSRSYITRRNGSAIDLYIPAMNEPGSYMFVCGLDKRGKLARMSGKNILLYSKNDKSIDDYIGVSPVRVNVGYAPKNVTNFRCISYNWDDMYCTFDKEYNSIYTNYNLTYGGVLSTRAKSLDINPNDNSTSYTFQVVGYYSAYEVYYFTLDMRNQFGSNQQTFKVNTFDCVKPDPPSMMNVTKREPTRVTLTWKLHYKLKVFEREFIYEGKYIRSPNEMGIMESQPLDMSKLVSASMIDYSLTIDGLYAHMWYEVQIRVGVPNISREELWSNYTKFQFQTLPKIPDRPPDVNIGSFYLNDHNDLWLYWKPLPLEEQNGNNSHYVISSVRNGKGTELTIQASNLTTIMAKFQEIRDEDFTFTIRSANSEGESIDGSTIYVPSRANRFPLPTDLKKYSIDYKYKLTWAPPSTRQDELTSYTVFWCESKTNYPSECNGPMFFETVNTTTHEYELANTKAINLALSANSRNSSSGMLWSMCTASKSDEIGKLNMVYVSKMDATYMEIQWKLDCMDEPIVAGYMLTYCPIIEPKNISCKPGTEIMQNITGTTQYNITGLMPYTTYKTTIAMFSNTRTGRPSDPLVNTTLEAAPTPPRNLAIRHVSNVSVSISWDPPERANGFLKNYEVWCNNSKIIMYDGIKENKTIYYTIENLQTFSYYEIVVLACTITCSNKSDGVNVTTEMGVPDPISSKTDEKYEDYTLLSWARPRHVGGNLDYYEVAINIREGVNKTQVYTKKLNATKCWMYHSCQKSWTGIELKVRAVNVVRSPHDRREAKSSANSSMSVSFVPQHPDPGAIPTQIRDHPSCLGSNDAQLQRWLEEDPHPKYLESDYTNIFNYYCRQNNSSPLLYIFIIFVGIVGTVALMVFGYRKCKTMSDIKVVLPDALNDINKDPKCPKMGEMIDGGGVLRNVQIHRDMRVQQDEQERSLLRNHMESSSSSTTSSTANVDNQSQCESHDGPPEELDSMEEHHMEEDDKHSIESQPEETPRVSFDVLKPEKLDEMIIRPTIEPQQMHQVAICPGVNQYVHFARPSQGYTQLASLKAPMKTPMATETDETGISGYVTRKQLADFGQRM